MGTTAIFRKDNAGEGVDPRYDLNCPVYTVGQDATTCQAARDPITKKQGCRICWTRPTTRVCFTAH